MATGTIAPSPVFTGFNSNGDPLSGGLLYTYVAGTTTPSTTYSDVALTTAHANPIVLDSAGRASIFLTPGASYKFLLKTSAGATVWTADNISAVPTSASSLDVVGVAGTTITAGQVVYLSDGSGSTTAGRWYLADADFTYASSLAPMIGIAQASLTAGESGTIRTGGMSDNLSGLSAGSLYYVSATAGALTATPPTNMRFVGAAQSTTALVFDSPEPAINATTLTGGTVADARLPTTMDAKTLTAPTLTNYRETKATGTISSGTLSVSLNSGNHFAVALNANITTFTLTNVPTSGTACAVVFLFTADGTARTITWPSGTVWPSATAPTMTSTNNKRDIISLYTVDGGTTWFGAVIGQNF